MTQPTSQARTLYRALLREIPRPTLSTPSPLHHRLRTLFRSEPQTPSTLAAPTPSHTSPSSSSIAGSMPAQPFSTPLSADERALRFQEAEQFARYAKAQRMYVELLERYNPGMNLEEEERIRLTARRVGFDLPELHDPSANAKE